MNILCVDQYGDMGGAQKTLVELLPSFAIRRWKVQAALPEGTVAATFRKLGHVTNAIRIGSYSKVQKSPLEILRYACEGPGLARTLQQIVRSQAIGLIYVNGPRVLPAAAWAAKRCSTQLIFHCHNRLHQGSAVHLAGRSLQLANAQVIACCRFVAEPLERFVNARRLRIIYNGVASSAGTPTVNRSTNGKRIGVIGRIEHEKGQLEFVRAARIINQRFPEASFSVIGAPMFSGTGYLEQVQKAAVNLPVTFEGWKDNMSEVFASLDVVVVPSSALDATPRVIIEALSRGIPVVAFAAGGIPEIIRDRETGFLVRENTPAALALGIEAVLQMDPGQLQAIQNKARQISQEHYSLSKCQNEICDLMQQVGMAA